MKITERTVKRLSEIITGDKKLSPYRGGPQLVRYFNDLGTNHVYGQGFPSRWRFAEECIREFNDKSALKAVILAAFDPRDYLEESVYDATTGTRIKPDIDEAINYLNEMLSFDGYKIVSRGNKYDVISTTHNAIKVDIKFDEDHLSHAYISEQIDKCQSKISTGDYDGAITNARTLIEAVLIAMDKEFDKNAPNYDGDLPRLYKRVQKHLNLTPDNPNIGASLNESLRGFISIINGLSSLSNKMGDRHAREYKPEKHHALLIVNTAMTFTNFIFDTYAYQKK